MSRFQNAFLHGLSNASHRGLEPHLTSVDLPHAIRLQEPGDRVEWVYFPETALISLLARSTDGHSVETSMAGNEGASGLAEACGSGESATEAVVQVDGRAARAPAAAVRALAHADAAFSMHAWKLVELQLAESRQSALCNALHLVERRFARWMLESSERSGGRNPVPVTQEFLAAMLGVQRTTVTAFATQLQQSGLIEYRRGQIRLLDLAGLEARSCECRAATREQRERLGLTLKPQASAPREFRPSALDGA